MLVNVFLPFMILFVMSHFIGVLRLLMDPYDDSLNEYNTFISYDLRIPT